MSRPSESLIDAWRHDFEAENDALLDDMSRATSSVLEQIAAGDQAAPAGFVASLAVVELTGRSLSDVKRVGSSALNDLSGEVLGAALAVSFERSKSYAEHGQRLPSQVWALLNNALVARNTAELLKSESHEPRHWLRAMSVSDALMHELSKFIYVYAEWSDKRTRAMSGARHATPLRKSQLRPRLSQLWSSLINVGPFAPFATVVGSLFVGFLQLPGWLLIPLALIGTAGMYLFERVRWSLKTIAWNLVFSYAVLAAFEWIARLASLYKDRL